MSDDDRMVELLKSVMAEAYEARHRLVGAVGIEASTEAIEYLKSLATVPSDPLAPTTCWGFPITEDSSLEGFRMVVVTRTGFHL